ncbi:hypothetical protein [Rubinisphaera sp.]|uniref:hypothetical protein n=1 Tax=Rubinisphaera sp. TaxID=2024857 RepID=UPI000C0C9C99|nr:hypothetical protein [Rubinisphaera sp.]MBV09003.1 hypothetical protein [Rubinisphaera sp.]HCS53265.1 hypothetical protein [Planctomycetaceae bacterium]|tara:strand:+ start:465 stop:1088 length:624 start_codon:yes stop_codon:yes gene_type:complete
MNCDTITMSQDEAEERLESYLKAMNRNPKQVTDLDLEIIKALQVAKKGGRLLDVNQAIAAGGLNRAGLPRLAIARAHVKMTTWRSGRNWDWRSNRSFSDEGGGYYDWRTRNQRISDSRTLWELPGNSFDRELLSNKRVQALTPLIPLPLRPKSQLKNYFVLWEANWHPAPPTDPYLLRPLAGALMEIVAEWDVSPLELAAVNAAAAR